MHSITVISIIAGVSASLVIPIHLSTVLLHHGRDGTVLSAMSLLGSKERATSTARWGFTLYLKCCWRVQPCSATADNHFIIAPSHNAAAACRDGTVFSLYSGCRPVRLPIAALRAGPLQAGYNHNSID